MSDDRWQAVLVLGGIRSGKSAFAEALVADAASVRYVATAVGGEDDPEWLARIEEHQRRRPQSWSTEETGADPARLTALLAEAKPDETLLVDDLGGWTAALLDPSRQPNDDRADVAALAAAVRDCPARVVLVSPEVGLAVVPATPVGRAFADALGETNQALARACDRVALVVAGQAVWLKPTAYEAAPSPVVVAPPAGSTPAPPPTEAQMASSPPVAAPLTEAVLVIPPARPAPATSGAPTLVTVPGPAPAAMAGLDEPTMVLPLVGSGTTIEAGMELPLPDADAGPDARDRLATVDFAGAGLGVLGEAVEFAAAAQVTTTPRPWSAPRVLVLSSGHGGGAAAGDDPAEVERLIAQVENGSGVLSRLAGEAGADVAVLRLASVGAMEDGPVLDGGAVEALLRQGWQLADAAAEDGRDVLVLASIGVGTDAVATAVLAATTGAEPVAMLPRVLKPGGFYDDHAWMRRCAAVRDAAHRIRYEPRGAKDLLCQLGGPDFAVAAGALLGAAARRMPVLLDGPVGAAAALIARDVANQIRHWCLVPEAGTLALVRQAADVLGLPRVLNLGLSLGEGANALAALPLLRSAIGLAADTPVHPSLLPAATRGDADQPPTDDAAPVPDPDPTDNAADPTDALPAPDPGPTDAGPLPDRKPDRAPTDTHDNPDPEAEPRLAHADDNAGPGQVDAAPRPDQGVPDTGDLTADGAFAEPEPDGPGPATTGG